MLGKLMGVLGKQLPHGLGELLLDYPARLDRGSDPEFGRHFRVCGAGLLRLAWRHDLGDRRCGDHEFAAVGERDDLDAEAGRAAAGP